MDRWRGAAHLLHIDPARGPSLIGKFRQGIRRLRDLVMLFGAEHQAGVHGCCNLVSYQNDYCSAGVPDIVAHI